MPSEMTATDWAAIIGALAWLPQIVGWVRDYFAKPKLAFFPTPNPEIGFSSYGVLVNLQCAISTSVTDAVIERMEVELVHEKGQRLVLPWQGIHETIDEIEMPTGEIERRRRQGKALAMKVTVEELAEKTIMFQDVQFQNSTNEVFRAVENRRDRLAATEPEEQRAAMLIKSDEFTNLSAMARAGLSWQVGEYTATFRIGTAEVTKPFEFRYRFRLDETDIARLRENVDYLVALISHSFAPVGEAPAKTWNWRYPKMLGA